MVLSLEVAEHLPKESAENFVLSLTNLGDIVVFSAAIPFQGGTNHLNERYQSYWKELFQKRGYVPFNLIREEFWDNNKVLSHYLQNTLIYVKKSKIKKYSILHSAKNSFQLDIVHPREYERYARICVKIKKIFPKPLLGFLRKFK
jgi:hypothetical protein